MFNNLLYLNLVSRMSEWSIVISSMHLTSLKQQQSLAYRHVYTWSIASSFVSHPSLLQLQHLPSFLASTFAPMMFLWLDSCCNFLLSFSSFLWLCFSFPVLLLCLCYLPLSIVTSPFLLLPPPLNWTSFIYCLRQSELMLIYEFCAEEHVQIWVDERISILVTWTFLHP